MSRASPTGRLGTGDSSFRREPVLAEIASKPDDDAGAAAPARAVVENVRPCVDGGRFPIKRVVGESVRVTADAFTDGHDALAVVLKHRCDGDGEWVETAMRPLGNDAWEASFEITRLERHRYCVEAWVDHFETWRRGLQKKLAAEQATTVDLAVGAGLLRKVAKRARGADTGALEDRAAGLAAARPASIDEAAARGLDPELSALVGRYPDRSAAAHSEPALAVEVERGKARFSTWYELFPRSCSPEPGRHGTFADVIARLPYVAGMGFDVLYLPPIHPIGRVHRKGKNNRRSCEAGDVGSPWAIGSKEGGHDAILPELGTLDDFRRLVDATREHGIEIALDLAFQCAPDHPWVEQHPEWFRMRPDGTVQYAENPPKKYEDIYPLEFEGPAWRSLWEELLRVVLHWVEQGVRIFRVDNPHTKPFRFWEWLIAEVRSQHRDVVFLAEAFTRPRPLYHLARLGFSQSYNYFPWRNTKQELVEYLTELTRTDVAEYCRVNFWPNTPDILTEPLQAGGPAAFKSRLVLAATLTASYGIYGPAYELCEARPREPGGEEYLDSEKYQLRHWPLDRHDSLRPFITRVNRIRRENPALQWNDTLRFHRIDNDQMLAYSKTSPDGRNAMIVVVNLDPHHRHSGWLDLDLDVLGIGAGESFQAHDLLSDARFFWQGGRNYVELDPAAAPAHLFRLRVRSRSERDFDYFL